MHSTHKETFCERNGPSTGMPANSVYGKDEKVEYAFDLTQSMIRDVKGRIRVWTQGAQELYGWTPEEAVGTISHDLLRTDFPAPVSRINETLCRERSWTGELKHYSKDGREVFVASHWARYDDSDGQVLVIEVNHDITDRKKAEQEASRLNQELSQFAFVAAHDLQTPLRNIKTCAQLLAQRYEGRFDEYGNRFLGHILSASETMQALIEGLLSYAQEDLRSPGRDEVSLSAVIENVVATLKIEIDATGAEVIYESLPVLRADIFQLSQLFQNLIGNALKYRGEEPPRVIISAELDERQQQWRFFVRDNGIGISREDCEGIFAPLKRLHGPEIQGSGIGLAICKKIVERSGGRIWVESQLGQGSTFYFTLPAVPNAKSATSVP